MICKLLTENLKTTQPGVSPKISVVDSLLYQEGYDLNSWFAIGHFDTNGHKLNYLFHIMYMSGISGMEDFYLSIVSVTDETTGFYFGEEKLCPASQAKVSKDSFRIEMANGLMEGTWDNMKIHCELPCATIDTTATAYGYPIYSHRTAQFPLLGMLVHQYSIPFMKTTGTMVINNEVYDVTKKGYTWFDRQWQNQDMSAQIKWSWMAIYLDNGYIISTLNSDVPGQKETFATIMHPDGSLRMATPKPLSEGESEFWYSDKSYQNNPTKWHLEIPEVDSVLDISVYPKEQEIVSNIPPLHKYEGASSKVNGTFNGEKVTGHVCIELIGTWPKTNN